MIKVEPCKGCGGVLLVDRFMGVTVRCDPTPLDAQAAGRALVGGQTLHRVHAQGGRPSSFGSATPAVLGALRTEPSERPMVVPEHRCGGKASGAPVGAVQGGGGTQTPKAPQSPPVDRTAPLSGPSTVPSGAPTAERRRSRVPLTADRNYGSGASPRCSGCGEPCADGTYASIELGKILVWAHHTEHCGG